MRMETLAEQQKFLKRKRACVKFAHLNPALQEIIGHSFLDFKPEIPLRSMRSGRLANEAAFAINAADIVFNQPHPWKGLSATFALATLGGRILLAKGVQERHQQLVDKINSYGILSAEHEKHYPPNWMRPAEVARTHPIFFVAMNGDLIFLRENRAEHARWKFQQTKAGKAGLNLWRWRAYLRPPKAPESVFSRAKHLAGKLLPAPGLQHPAGSSFYRRPVKRA